MFLYKWVFCSDHAHFTCLIEPDDSGPNETEQVQETKDRSKAAFDCSNSDDGAGNDRQNRETSENEVQDPIYPQCKNPLVLMVISAKVRIRVCINGLAVLVAEVACYNRTRE